MTVASQSTVGDRYGLITARGGSKRLPGKNSRILCGKPMLVWTVEAAIAAGLDHVVVSTDDEELADIARQAGADVPFLRPTELATDAADSVDVAQHAIEALGWQHGTLILLQPTSPLRTAEDILGCLDLMTETGSSSCISVGELARPPDWTYSLTDDGRLLPAFAIPRPRPRYVQPNGAVYAIACSRLLDKRRFVLEDTRAYVMPHERSIDIDDELDFRLAEMLMRHHV